MDEDFKKTVRLFVMLICGMIAFMHVMFYMAYRIDVSRSPETIVYVDGEKVYEGNSYYYKTASRGQGTIVQIYEKSWYFPKLEKELLSNNVKIITK